MYWMEFERIFVEFNVYSNIPQINYRQRCLLATSFLLLRGLITFGLIQTYPDDPTIMLLGSLYSLLVIKTLHTLFKVGQDVCLEPSLGFDWNTSVNKQLVKGKKIVHLLEGEWVFEEMEKLKDYVARVVYLVK